MAELKQLLELSAALHPRLCPRQVLGVRMGMYAARLLHLNLPQTDKRLLTVIETDGCFADGVSIATGCAVGHRTLRVVDYGKVAAVFVDTATEKSLRIAPRLDIRQAAWHYAPHSPDRWHAQLAAYQIMPDEDLFIVQPVTLEFSIPELLGEPGRRAVCSHCGEEILNGREVIQAAVILCRVCAGESYYHSNTEPLPVIEFASGQAIALTIHKSE